MIHTMTQGRKPTIFGDGEQSRGWTFVSDVVDATMLAMERGKGVYNVGGAIEASMNDTIALFEEISGRTLDVAREGAVPGDQRRTNADTTRIRSELGWSPAESFESGLARTVRWYLDNEAWLAAVTSKEYQRWITLNYSAVPSAA